MAILYLNNGECEVVNNSCDGKDLGVRLDVYRWEIEKIEITE